jgi:hypothetical protein
MGNESKDKGWIALHRSIQNHFLWDDKPFSKGQAFIDMLLLSNHKDNKFLFGNSFIEVKRGSFITSELKLMERWGWSKSKVRAFLNVLEKDSMIVKKSDRKKTTITIVNYSVYQDLQTTEKPIKNHRKTTKEPLKDTNNNDKTMINNEEQYFMGVENANYKKSHKFVEPTLEEVQQYVKEKGFNVNAEQFIDYYKARGWELSKGRKIKDWKACVRTWSRNNKLDTGTVNNKQTSKAAELAEFYNMAADWGKG